MKRRILQVNLNNQGGAFSVAFEVQKQLERDFVFDYFSADLFINNAVYKELLRMGSKCVGGVKSKSRILKQYFVYKKLVNYLKSNSYEYVHIHSDTAWKMLIYYFAAKKVNRKNIIVHSHSSGISGHYRIFSYFLHLLSRPAIKQARYKCACSDVAALWMFGTTKNVRIIRNGVDIEKYKYKHSERMNIRKKYGINNNQLVIGTVGDFSYPKNPEFLFKLVKKFVSSPQYLFLMVGNRSEGCKLKDMADRDHGINNVTFAGTVTDVGAFLSAMDIFILPSRFEGLPMCAIEAQVSGLYTIISDKVTKQTKCSKHFSRLSLNADEWYGEIKQIELDYDRNNLNEYLEISKAASTITAEGFKKVYSESNGK